MSPLEPKPGPPPARPSVDESSEPRLGLSLSQLVASALAAASAAFGASYLGVAGTIIGAAVASVIFTVASAMYTSSLHRTRHAVRSTVTQWSRTTATAPVVDPGAPLPPADREPDDTRELVLAPEPAGPRRPLPWARITLAASAVLAITLGVLTGVEGLLGQPIASVVGGSDATGTSLGSVTGSGGSSTTKSGTTPTPTTSGTPTSTPTSTPTAEPTAAPTSDPSGSATAAPTETPTSTPTSTPTAEPTATPTSGG